ncbi:MAG TPA: ATP-binding cassette domain-containing protein, partial [Gemmatimonadales bacterium]|nr:ATP-binding cassette domain-containing protein [Gemmatimonadales bacterium]
MPPSPASPGPTHALVPKPPDGPAPAPGTNGVAVQVREFTFAYGKHEVLQPLTFDIPRKSVTAIIGPSGCGKSTFLRSINRLNDLIAIARYGGDIQVEGQSVFTPGVDLVALRLRVGMVFQRPNPFPKSIFDNVAY